MKRVLFLVISLLFWAPSSAAPKRGARAEEDAAALVERAGRAAVAKDRKALLACLNEPSRALYERVVAEGGFDGLELDGRKAVRPLELRRHDSRPWAAALVPVRGGDGREPLFLRREPGGWRLDLQHLLLDRETVGQIMRSAKGERRAARELAAPTLLPKQLKTGALGPLGEGWDIDDPRAEDDWSRLPRVQEAFLQRLKGPREKSVHAKFVLFAQADDAEWELWRRRTELDLRDELAAQQPALGDAAMLGRHSSSSYELFLRKGRSLLILHGNSEDVVPIAQLIAGEL